jgi:hypothetical protein
MPALKKTLLKTGVYHAPQGEFRAHRKRLERLVKTFEKMRDAGIRVPVSWGHSPFATPANDDERAKQQHWLSAHNAGYVPDLKLTRDGNFDAVLDVPGVELDRQGDLVHWVRLPDGRQVRGKVGEVSIAVKPWRDGSGKDWGEALVHVALTPHPVAHDHGGFSLSACTADAPGYTLCLTDYTRTLSASEEDDVADEDKDKPDKGEGGDKAKPFEKKGKGGDSEGGGGSKDYFKEGMAFLSERGISLPDDTTDANFWERLCIAAHALEHAETTTGEDMIDEPPPMDEPLPEEPEATFTDEDAAGGGVTEEQQPVMMSLANAKDPATKALLAREQGGHRRRLLARIDRLARRGLKPKLAEELRGKVGEYTLSLDGDYNPVSKRLDERISDLELSLPNRHPLAGLKTSGEAPRVDPRQNGDRTKEQEKVGDELALLAGAPPSRTK